MQTLESGKSTALAVRLWLSISTLLLPAVQFPGELWAEDIARLQAGVVKVTAKPPQGTANVGTGFIVRVDKEAVYIVTAAHVVAGDTHPKVEFFTKRNLPVTAEVLGLEGDDEVRGLALLVVKGSENIPKGLNSLSFSGATRLTAGKDIMVIGFPRNAGPWAIVKGNISSRQGRDIFFSPSIESGHSGGPIFQDGKVIAMVGAGSLSVGRGVTIRSVQDYIEGFGITTQESTDITPPVPSDVAQSIMEQHVQTCKVVRGWLGVSIQELTPELASQFGITETKGVFVSDVIDDSPAQKVGFKRADFIVEYDSKPMDSPAHLRNAVAQTSVGKKVTIKFIRDNKARTIDLTIVGQPKSMTHNSEEDGGKSATPTGVLSSLDVRDLTEELASRYGLKSSERGVVIARVRPGSAAEELGVTEGDILLEVNCQAVTSVKIFERVTSKLPKDQAVLLLLKRQGRMFYLTLH